LLKSAQEAKERGFDYFATTLSISPMNSTTSIRLSQ